MNSASPRSLVIVMRGLPGSGKSTWCLDFLRRNWPNLTESEYQQLVFSTDKYFINNGVYCFDADNLSRFHKKNLAAFIQTLQENPPVIICDNTNLQQAHWWPYIEAALKQGANWRLVLLGDPLDISHQQRCALRNQHKVSLTSIAEMANKYDSY